MDKRDFIVIGDNLTAVALAYHISLQNTEKSILLINSGNEYIKQNLFAPGIISPQVELSSKNIGGIFETNLQTLSDLQSITGYFNISTRPLNLVYRDKNQQKLLEEHKKRLDSALITNSILTREDIVTLFPLLNVELDMSVISIHESALCQNVQDLVLTYKKLAEENGVETIILPPNHSKVDISSSMIKNGDYMVNYEEFLYCLKPNIYPFHEKNSIKAMVVKTPILEKFPRVNLIDYSSSMYLSLEETGNLNIYQIINEKHSDNSKYEMFLQHNFASIFPSIGDLQIADSIEADTAKEINISKEKKSFFISMPWHAEISLAPALTTKLAQDITLAKRQNGIVSIYDYLNQ